MQSALASQQRAKLFVLAIRLLQCAGRVSQPQHALHHGLQIKQLRLLNADVPEETMVAIAAAAAAYLGHRAKRRAAHFTTSAIWQSGTRRRQHAHEPLHLR